MKRSLVWSVGTFLVAAGVAAVAGVWPRAAVGEDAAAGKVTYIGSDGCKKCHFKQHTSWKKTAMFNAFEHLKPDQSADKKTAAKLDPKADYTKDPKCLKCHTTGYGKEGGYPEVVEGKAWTKEEQDRAALLGNGGCEACHGPGSKYSIYKKDHKDYKRADVLAMGLVHPNAETCAPCHTKGGCPTMAPDYKLDVEAVVKDPTKTHEKVPLKEKHD